MEITPPSGVGDTLLSDKEFRSLSAQAANYRTILNLLKASGIDQFLEIRRMLPIDLELSPNDTTGRNSVNIFLKSIADECNRMDQKITSLSEALVDCNILLAKEKRKTQKKTLLEWIKERILWKPSK